MTAVLTWLEATRVEPCPICDKSDWCTRTAEGTYAICRRLDTGQGRHKVDQAGGDYWVYRLDQSSATPAEDLRHLPRRRLAKPTDAETLDRVYRALLEMLTLSAVHREALQGRGLSDDEIRRRGYRT